MARGGGEELWPQLLVNGHPVLPAAGSSGEPGEPCTAVTLAGSAVVEAGGKRQVMWPWVDPCPLVAPSLSLHVRDAFLPVYPPRALRSSLALLTP